jgi:ADP-heptose:LPS heptosyltransferase
VVTGTDRERDLVAAAASDVPGATTLAGDLDLAGLAALLAGAAVVVANNSGGVHLADAVGTPVVDVFAGTETVDQYRPRSVPAVVLTRPTTCAPCRQLICPFDHECLDVPPAEVADAALGLLPVVAAS